MWSVEKIPSNINVFVTKIKSVEDKKLKKSIVFGECLGSRTEKTYPVIYYDICRATDTYA
jgi:hypothetical protein